jgi:uncharacterized protein (UPF0335 family)
MKWPNTSPFRREPYRLIDEGKLSRTNIRGCLRMTISDIERYEKELEKQMDES